MIEILAPCGGAESLTAALGSGADAVYLGIDDFSARRNAENFTAEQLNEAVRLCHYSGVKVYVALNTLVYDDEMEKLEKAIKTIDESKADAVIIQDMGVAEKVREIAPELHIHASTQMTVTSVGGAEFAKNCGFSRVVLARELSLQQIEEIVKSVDIETEVFVHGALCVCLSGQCYMSAVFGGRSGNRGLCAQPCRLNFTDGERENILSLKDLSIIPHLKELEKIGVKSAKIEGRMKRPEYVAAAVNACRKELSGEDYKADNLQEVFSRSGFTDGYYTDNYNNMQGIRTKDDVIASQEAVKRLHELYKSPYKRFTVDFDVEISAQKPMKCKATADGLTAEAYGDTPEKALNKAVSADEAAERIAKLGGTVYNAGKVNVRIDDELAVSASALNSLRRAVLEALSDRILHKYTPKR